MALTALVRRSWLWVLVGNLGVLTLSGWLYDRHHFAVRWPADIQRETIGSTVAAGDRLLSKERSFASGEGFARWKYQANASDKALRRFCRATPVSRCSFSRSHAPEEGVTTSVSLSRGIITVEEIRS
jgi:hypothetical protein